MSTSENCFYYNKYEEKLIINSTEDKIINEYNNFLDIFQSKTKEAYLKLTHINKLNIDSSTFYKPFDNNILVCLKTLSTQQISWCTDINNDPNSKVDKRLGIYWKFNSNKDMYYSIILVCKNNNNLLDAKLILFTSRNIILDINYFDYGKNKAFNTLLETKSSFNRDVLYSQIHEQELLTIIEEKKENMKKLINTMSNLKNINNHSSFFEAYLSEFIKINIKFYQNKILFVVYISNGDRVLISFNYSANINTNLNDCIKYIFDTGIKNLSIYIKYNKTNNKNLSDLLLKLLAYKINIDKI